MGAPVTDNAQTRDEAGTPSVRVLVVDDQPPFRRAANAVCSMTAGFNVVGEAESGEDAVDKAAELTPDLILMDINLPGINGIEATRRITEARPETVVVLLSTYKAEDLPGDARQSGAVAYVNKEEFAPNILQDLWSTRADGALSGF
ncbi:MAG: response regulator transcription factor [Actinobacteria bacterium]|nr:response regulator transcription factor [Actinomycetota bacterium]MBV8961354.1 response regulator transcription factor [Actinomycetota bacterium]MBV9666447.1 response regulator transcription factor [Actinomycetota bacterium]MBV9935710.1 response regulator transcription factor [Actinomycetota bacterium]